MVGCEFCSRPYPGKFIGQQVKRFTIFFIEFRPIIICLWEIDPQKVVDRHQVSLHLIADDEGT